MTFKTAAEVEANVYTMLLADQPRANNRALVNRLFDGFPPYSEEEAEINKTATNVNDLSASKINHDARSQFDNAFLVPDPLFTIDCDYGPAYKRLEWSNIITSAINKPIKNSAAFAEMQQSVFANVVLHGPGPSIWNDRECWLQDPLGVEDVLVPGKTLRSMTNLEGIAIYRQYSGDRLWRMTHGPKTDKAWNMPLVDECIAWVNQQAKQLNGNAFPDAWFPEKLEKQQKSDAGLYTGDNAPTVDCWDFYFYNDNGKQSGWNRRIILDAWGQPGFGGAPLTAERKIKHGEGKFLYNPDDKVYADKLDQIIHFQSGDASAVAPFRYHSQRSLGWLLYAVCHLQNRLYCKFTDSVFESLMQYFRVSNPADMDRLTKIDLIDKGLLPEGMQFVRPEERWQVNEGLVDRAFQLNRMKMNDMSSSFSQDFDQKGAQEETATRTMAKVNATAALIGAILNRAYIRERFRYMEICRRFCIKNSKDADVRAARLEILKKGVPPEAMDSERWNIQPTKVIGQGNKILGAAIADKLMGIRPLLNPSAQNEVTRMYVATNADNWALAKALVPDEPHISRTIHDSETVFGTLFQGIPVNPIDGLNNLEVAETILRLMDFKIKEIEQTSGMGTPQNVIGLDYASKYADAYIKKLAEDKASIQQVKFLNDTKKNLDNMIKAFAQRQQQAAEAAAQQNGHAEMSPEDQAKLQAILLTAQTKSEIQQKNAANKQAQKQLAFEQKTSEQQQKHALEIQQSMIEHQAELAKTGAETVHSMRINTLKAKPEE